MRGIFPIVPTLEHGNDQKSTSGKGGYVTENTVRKYPQMVLRQRGGAERANAQPFLRDVRELSDVSVIGHCRVNEIAFWA